MHTVRKSDVAMFAPPLPPQATFGVEERSAVSSLEGWIAAHHSTWLDSDGIARWGALPGLALDDADGLSAALDDLRDRFVPRSDEGA